MNIVEIALFVGLSLSFLIAVALGGNDTTSPTANVVGARIKTIRRAVITFTVFTTVGALS